LLLATANPGKVAELTLALGQVAGLELMSLRDFAGLQLPPETGATMRANALLKARFCADSSGLPSLADDSGLEVEALDGEPGVRSARWCAGTDADRTRALLQRLQATPAGARQARFRCALCLAWPLGAAPPIEVEGVCEGAIAMAPRGANGFGYDPIFEVTTATGTAPGWLGRTLAEAPPEVKAQVSHRARAIAALCEELAAMPPTPERE
jgi:XTP/dITP diphosphohydrolase